MTSFTVKRNSSDSFTLHCNKDELKLIGAAFRVVEDVIKSGKDMEVARLQVQHFRIQIAEALKEVKHDSD
ncbi:hypothetical protein M0R72_20145 [Candidatus Pacearchaeota archaeon]|nr:hypothetical protein [Candidatus Pacearchaeota archaeon]